MAHFLIRGLQHPDGIATENAKPGEILKVLTRASLTSDDRLFHRIIEEVTPTYFGRPEVGIIPDNVVQFALVLHPDGTADLHVNDFITHVEIMAKLRVEAGTIVNEGDIADIRRVRLPEIAVGPQDKLVYCFKAGWKFGLFFDLGSPRSSTLDDIEVMCGTLRRYLSFQHVYDGLTGLDAALMRSDGWFPFAELLGRDFRRLHDAYSPGADCDGLVERIVAGFTPERLNGIMARWWTKPAFKAKQDLLEAGVQAFNAGTRQGDIQCVKTLYSEIEGLIRAVYLEDTGKGGGVRITDLLKHIVERGRAKSGSDQSLLLPTQFLTYLEEVLFAHFNVDTRDIDLSRNSSSHGVARGADYTRARALQGILAADQLCLYI